jgi:hypothetical protein
MLAAKIRHIQSSIETRSEFLSLGQLKAAAVGSYNI